MSRRRRTTPAAGDCSSPAERSRLFPLRDAVGETIKLSNQEFRGIRVLAERKVPTGGDGLALFDINEDVYLPITIAMDYGTHANQHLR